jgi:hypothetical protein
MVQKAQIKVPGLKVAVPLKADALPQDLVPPDGPAGEPVIELHLDGSPLAIAARINGKNYRKMLRTVAEHGQDQVAIVLQGNLRPGSKPGTLTLESAGFQVNVKAPAAGAQPPVLPVPGNGQ